MHIVHIVHFVHCAVSAVDCVDFQDFANRVKLLATLEIQRDRFIVGKVPSNSIWSVRLLLLTVFAALEHQVSWHA